MIEKYMLLKLWHHSHKASRILRAIYTKRVWADLVTATNTDLIPHTSHSDHCNQLLPRRHTDKSLCVHLVVGLNKIKKLV